MTILDLCTQLWLCYNGQFKITWPYKAILLEYSLLETLSSQSIYQSSGFLLPCWLFLLVRYSFPTQASFVEILSIPDLTNIPSQYFFLPRQSYPCPLYYMQMYVLESWGYMHRYFPWIFEKHVKLNIFKIDLWSPILCTPSNWSFSIKPHKKKSQGFIQLCKPKAWKSSLTCPSSLFLHATHHQALPIFPTKCLFNDKFSIVLSIILIQAKSWLLQTITRTH